MKKKERKKKINQFLEILYMGRQERDLEFFEAENPCDKFCSYN